jgi:CheY-like chemotaxis protein
MEHRPDSTRRGNTHRSTLVESITKPLYFTTVSLAELIDSGIVEPEEKKNALPARNTADDTHLKSGDNTTALEQTTSLVVDDEHIIADTLAAILQANGFAASAAYSGKSALEKMRSGPPDVVISDVVMPGMSGIELAIAIRDSYPGCKILLFSGNAATGDLLETARRRGYEFPLLSKPVPPQDLLRLLSDWGLPRVAHTREKSNGSVSDGAPDRICAD